MVYKLYFNKAVKKILRSNLIPITLNMNYWWIRGGKNTFVEIRGAPKANFLNGFHLFWIFQPQMVREYRTGSTQLGTGSIEVIHTMCLMSMTGIWKRQSIPANKSEWKRNGCLKCQTLSNQNKKPNNLITGICPFIFILLKLWFSFWQQKKGWHFISVPESLLLNKQTVGRGIQSLPWKRGRTCNGRHMAMDSFTFQGPTLELWSVVSGYGWSKPG